MDRYELEEARLRRLTKHFTFEEMTRTSTQLTNIPKYFQLHNLLHLCRTLEMVRKRYKKPIVINSAFRTPEVNTAVGGVPNSYHLDGRSADIDISSISTTDADLLYSLLDDYMPIELIRKPCYIHVTY